MSSATPSPCSAETSKSSESPVCGTPPLAHVPRGIDLVHDQKHAVRDRAQPLSEVLLLRKQARASVDDPAQELRFIDRDVDVAADLLIERRIELFENPAGIDETEGLPVHSTSDTFRSRVEPATESTIAKPFR